MGAEVRSQALNAGAYASEAGASASQPETLPADPIQSMLR